MIKGYHVLDGNKRLNSYPEYQIKPQDFSRMSAQFEKLYKFADSHGLDLETDLSIVLGDWRKFDPDYAPDELVRAIVEEGKQTREFKHWYYHQI